MLTFASTSKKSHIMKTTSIFFLTLLAATLTLASCKSDNTEPEPIPHKDLIRTITTDSYTAEFIYNEADWSISRIDMQYNQPAGTSTGTINFTWSNDRLDIENINGDYILKYSFTHEDGRATAMYSDENDTPAATFGYDGEGRLSSVVWRDGYKDTYTWENGNMTAVSGLPLADSLPVRQSHRPSGHITCKNAGKRDLLHRRLRRPEHQLQLHP